MLAPPIEIGVELVEKAGLLTAAAMVTMLSPVLRGRFLGSETQRKDKLWIALLGVCLSAWGASLGTYFEGEHMNVRAVGVLIAGLLGGPRVGLLTGVIAGGFYGFFSGHVHGVTRFWVMLASIVDGVGMGWLATSSNAKSLMLRATPSWFWATRVTVTRATDKGTWLLRSPVAAFVACAFIQSVHLSLVALGHLLFEGFPAVVEASNRHLLAWPAHIAKMVASSAGVALYVATSRVALEAEEQRRTLIAAESAAKEAQLRALRSKVDPHFLFNALGSVRAMVRKDADAAREMLTDLSELFRYTLDLGSNTTLGHELELAQRYLAFEARRALGTLTFDVQEPDALRMQKIPSLILQPLIENAVLHGVAPYGGGHISVSVLRRGNDLELLVHNTHAKRELRRAHGNGTALRTLRERLQIEFGGRASVELVVDDEGARAKISVPIAI